MEYIPGYSTIKNIVGQSLVYPGKIFEYFSGKKVNNYELFTESFPSTSNTGEANIPIWSSNVGYSNTKQVKLDGVIYTCVVPKCLGDSPIKSIIDNNLQVNSNFWKYDRISSKVKQFNPDTGSNVIYLREEIVNNNDTLYKCKTNTCTPDFTSSNWTLLYSSVIETSGFTVENIDANPSFTDKVNAVIKDFTIEDIPDETLTDKTWRIICIAYPYALSITILFMAVIFASYSANDLLHKEVPYRILAFIYVFYCVSQLAFSNNQSLQQTLGAFIVIYYIYRCIIGPWIWPGIVELPIRTPILPMQPKVESEIYNKMRLDSHGDIDLMLKRAFRDASFSLPPPPSSVRPL